MLRVEVGGNIYRYLGNCRTSPLPPAMLIWPISAKNYELPDGSELIPCHASPDHFMLDGRKLPATTADCPQIGHGPTSTKPGKSHCWAISILVRSNSSPTVWPRAGDSCPAPNIEVAREEET